MKNVNRYLASSWRSDLFGFNMASRGISANEEDRKPEVREGGTAPAGQWHAPRLGMTGTLCLGHQVPLEDALSVKLMHKDKAISLHTVRNLWTPAYMDTTYRSEIDSEYYPRSGTVCVNEKKAILRNDTFVSHVKITNQRLEALELQVEISMPFTECGGIYTVDTETNARGLRDNYPVRGYAVLRSSEGARVFTLRIEPKMSVSFRYAMAFSPERDGYEPAEDKVCVALNDAEPFIRNERSFNEWFNDKVPNLESENEDILKVYYYRYYLIYRSIHQPDLWIENHPIPGKCMYESPYGDWFGTVIGLPIPWQIGEARWLRDETAVKNQIKNWAEARVNHQNYIQFTPWAVWQYYKLYPDKEWLRSLYTGFKKYAEERIEEGIPITRGSWMTGAEYQPAFYQYTDPEWDWRRDIEGKRLGLTKHVQQIYRADHITYVILSLIGCAEMAAELGESAECERFAEAAHNLRDFIKDKLWDSERGFFYGYDPVAGLKCDKAACYDGFAPLIDGILGKEYNAVFDRLFDEHGFLSDFGALTAERDCPMFWYDNCIAGPTASSVREPHHYGCSWNGPVWPYANSLISQSLGTAARSDKTLRKKWLSFFDRYTEVHFIYGDRSTPLICEHYRPDDGASFSPFADYFHSSWIDQFMRFYVGIDVSNSGKISFNPFAGEPFKLRGVKIGNKIYDFLYDGNGEGIIQEV